MTMNLPKDFIEYTRRLMGEELYAAFEKGMQEEAPVSIRLNPFKLNTAQVCVKDRETDVPWCRNAMYLKSRPNFTFDPMLHAGLYYVQEAASMFVDHVLREVVKKPVRMLDLCASPGGKSTCAYAA
ncbi:NOL1/NOP2/sun family protein, partial [Segatella oris C735]